MPALEWWELVMGGFVFSAEVYVPALVTFDSMGSEVSQDRGQSRRMFEESLAVCRVCDVLILLHGNCISTVDVSSMRKCKRCFPVMSLCCSSRLCESVLVKSYVPSSSPPTHDSSC